jgi:hypothetical protein
MDEIHAAGSSIFPALQDAPATDWAGRASHFPTANEKRPDSRPGVCSVKTNQMKGDQRE